MVYISMRAVLPMRRHLHHWERACRMCATMSLGWMPISMAWSKPRAGLYGEFLKTTGTPSQELRAFADAMGER
jgi:hypothetical protein